MTWLTDRFEGENVLDLGSGHKLKFYTCKDGGDTRVGGTLLHPKGPIETGAYAGEEWCCGSVAFDIPQAASLTGPKWQLLNIDPLHIEPSVLCGCGDHGWIRDGKWISA